MKIVLLSGKARSGKDTAAEMMRAYMSAGGNRVLVTHYADLLKFICTNYFGWDGKKDEKGRQLLQYIGTDVVRKQNPDLWVNFVAIILRCFGENWNYVIIPDCRFPNELSVLKEKGFDTVHCKIVRENFDNLLTDEQKKHPSETALDGTKPDFCLCNNGTLEDLWQTVARFIQDTVYA